MNGGYSMRKSISFNVDADVFDKFNMALNLSGETSDEAADSCLLLVYRPGFRKCIEGIYTEVQQGYPIVRIKIFTVRQFSVYRCGR